MGSTAKIKAEDLRKLEDAAYFELCQIIAEAMQYQDVELLNSRISAWKSKYKKLLDSSPANSKFKKRIEFLLTQYYSSVTQYILNQLKLKEKKMVENQSRAVKKLYNIIKDTNDLDLLKKKVKQWEQKYPISSFLKMYQKRIKSYTREKNLKENAFEQEEAFSDLVSITKINGTLDELKYKLNIWEKKYSINDKYDIDDFLKHQTEIKRFTSDEFLVSIAREEIDNDKMNKMKSETVEEFNNKSFSNLSVQESAYSSLLGICKSPNNIDEMFMWVYKNRYTKFNDKYKELILNATYLNYRPQYLNQLTIPDLDILKTSLSFDEYKNFDEIKRYAVISYFNMLLPPEKAIGNDYFTKHVQTIYSKSGHLITSDTIKENAISNEDILDNKIEMSLKSSISDKPKTELELSKNINKTSTKEDSNSAEIVIDLSDINSGLTISLENAKTHSKSRSKAESEANSKVVPKVNLNAETKTNIESTVETQTELLTNAELSTLSKTTTEFAKIENHTNENQDIIVSTAPSVEIENIEEKAIDHNTIIAFSPLFFETINNYNKQYVLVNCIDSTTNEYLESEKTNVISFNEPIKTINDEE